MTNAEIDLLVAEQSNKGVTKYQMLGILSSTLNLPLGEAENMSIITSLLHNSRRRLHRKGIDTPLIPSMFVGCHSPALLNKAFIETCEDIYFTIEQHIESLLFNYYEDNPEQHTLSVARKALKDSLIKSITGVNGEEAFSRNYKASVKLQSIIDKSKGNTHI